MVVVDIRIVNCHMYPGEPYSSSLVLSYIPAEASMQYIHPLYQLHLSTHMNIHGNLLLIAPKTVSIDNGKELAAFDRRLQDRPKLFFLS